MINNVCDFHIHTCFSSDSDGDVRATIEKAVSLGMKHMAITDHQDFGYPGNDFKLLPNINKYYDTLLSYKEEYKDKIDISIGCEVGLEADIPDTINDFVNLKPFDFIIGSSHLVHGIDIYYPEYYLNRSVEESMVEYFESVLENLDACSNFDVYGHVDYIVRYCPGKNSEFSYEKYKDYLDKILTKIISMGKGIEINTGGFRAGLGEPNPCFDIISNYRKLGGKIITFGSDAHKPEDVGSYFDDAAALAKKSGFTEYYVYKNRKPIPVML